MKTTAPLAAAFVATALMAGTASAGLQKEYHWSGNIAIPDGSGTDVPGATVFADIFVADFGAIDSLVVGLNVTHTWQGDLRVWLTHVDSGTSIYLINRPGRLPPGSTFGYSTDNYGNLGAGQQMLFDDSAPGTYNRAERGGILGATGVNNVVGSWRADDIAFEGFGNNNALSIFNGLDKYGTWRLSAADFAAGDTGALRTFSLYFTNVPAPGALALLGMAGLIGARRRRN